MVIIVGSGAGGAILAMELAKSNVPVTIIEKGKYIDSKDAFNYYDKYNGSVDLLTAHVLEVQQWFQWLIWLGH